MFLIMPHDDVRSAAVQVPSHSGERAATVSDKKALLESSCNTNISSITQMFIALLVMEHYLFLRAE